ncbi:MAG: nicotinate-nucleotide diphosphorylase (carboxylating) [Phycisphaeraceae bacterium]|nr:nicotinate-nucleotide diphosphorylase (carboxylating) [Phycisphaeraceae bacterium]
MEEQESHLLDADLDRLIRRAVEEDLGPDRHDATSACLIDPARRSAARFVARSAGRLCGAALLPDLAGAYDPAIELEVRATDGAVLSPGTVIATMTGSLRSVLAAERIALNFMTHLSGIATMTARFVEAVADTHARICDTRKTIPGLRALQKYAVVCGGGENHRIGLYDAVLVKDNHLAHIPRDRLESELTAAIERARSATPAPSFVEVEVDDLDQFERVLGCSPDRVLLDNMPPATMRQAVQMRDRLAPNVQLEASGGIDLSTVAEVARAGVDLISVGALTHSAPALDLALDVAS